MAYVRICMVLIYNNLINTICSNKFKINVMNVKSELTNTSQLHKEIDI